MSKHKVSNFCNSKKTTQVLSLLAFGSGTLADQASHNTDSNSELITKPLKGLADELGPVSWTICRGTPKR